MGTRFQPQIRKRDVTVKSGYIEGILFTGWKENRSQRNLFLINIRIMEL